MNCLTIEKRVQVISALSREIPFGALLRCWRGDEYHQKLLADLGTACAQYQDKRCASHLQAHQCDEIWQFCYAKDKNVSGQEGAYLDLGTFDWVALDADTKLVPSLR